MADVEVTVDYQTYLRLPHLATRLAELYGRVEVLDGSGDPCMVLEIAGDDDD